MATIDVPLRLCGRAFAAAGVLMALSSILHPNIFESELPQAVHQSSLWAPLHYSMFAAAVLTALGAVGFVAGHGRQLGAHGRAALTVTLVGCWAAAPVMVVEAFTFEPIATRAPELLEIPGPMITRASVALSAPVACWPVGIALLGWAAARVGARRPGWGLVAAAVAYVTLDGPFVPVLGPLSALSLALAMVWWGRWIAGQAPLEASAALPLRGAGSA